MTQTQTIQNPAFSSVVRERRSVRSYDPNFKISKEEMTDLLSEAILAPSSANGQPWRFLVIDSQPLKEKLLPIAYNQQQVVEASAIIAVLGDLESYKLLPTIFGRAVEAGHMPKETGEAFVANYTKMFSSLPPEAMKKIIYTDGGLVSMQLMLAAKARGYDTVPMGGYDAAKFVQEFGIGERYVPVMLIAVGKAVKEGHPSVRLAVDEVTNWNEFTL
ncbi:nitroreductase family protein [Cohnella endophytica]|uniref:Nitroreductase family protein n=1 Tax=Cohnella endophytica TaxID=2419778 RepID=A0A494X8S7_9BACL|nr:nitroreductase family protein [Cohnella endophytica]RKP44786.1 nitroreductase family protein [Cohnella endophytica]